MSSQHNKQTFDEVHSIVSYQYASTVARLAASGFAQEDLYKIARQTDEGTYWILTSTTPTWVQLKTGVESSVSASYITLSSTSSLSSERTLNTSGSSGIRMVDNGPGSTLDLSINDNVVATLTGSLFSGPVSASAGLSGSLQRIAPNIPYLVAGGGTTLSTQSNGQIHVSSSLFGSSFFQTSSNHPANNVFTNTTTTLRSALALTASNIVPGLYRVGWCFTWNVNNSANSMVAEFHVGTTSSWQMIVETSEVSPNERNVASYFTYMTLTGSTQLFDIRGRIEGTATNATASIYNREIEIWRVQ